MVRASIRSMTILPNALDAVGPEYEVATRSFKDLPLGPNESVTDMIDLVSPVRGEVVSLNFEWDYEDYSGVHQCRAPLIVRVH